MAKYIAVTIALDGAINPCKGGVLSDVAGIVHIIVMSPHTGFLAQVDSPLLLRGSPVRPMPLRDKIVVARRADYMECI